MPSSAPPESPEVGGVLRWDGVLHTVPCEADGMAGDVAGRLASVNVGMPRDVVWQGRTVHTAVWKDPVDGPRMVRRLNVDGDGQGDLGGHGGEMRAVFVYQLDSYRHWERELGRDDFVHGQFGENFTVEGLADDVVCIGDRYRIGDAVFEVSQPRVTCFRVGIRMDDPRIPALLVAHHRPGFYFRVLTEGEVRAGDEIVKVGSGPEGLTVADVDALLYLPGHSRQELRRALRVPALSPGWQASFRAMLDQDDGAAGNAGLAATSPPPAWPGFRPLVVSRIDRESDSVVSVHLDDPEGVGVPAALPGQYLTLRLPTEPDAPPVLRNYSLSGPPGADGYRISVKREEYGAASGYIHTRLRAGDRLEVAAPRGTFTLRPGDSPVLLISAGVGATPVLAMLHALAADRSGREVWWLHGARSGSDHSFAAEARALVEGLPNAHRHICFSRPTPGDTGDDFQTEGRLSASVLAALGLPPDAEAYICGPPAFMQEVSAALAALGLDPHHIHTELFGAAPSLTPGIASEALPPPHPPAGEPGSGPVVAFARSDLSVDWSPGYASLLELAEACDVPVRWSCRTGVCHNCETAVVSGDVRYSPDPVEEPGAGRALICCAQPRGDLVLDL